MNTELKQEYYKLIGKPSNNINKKLLYATLLNSPLGAMLAITDDNYLYLLEFVDARGVEKEIAKLRKHLEAEVIIGETIISKQINNELLCYFSGDNMQFNTPCYLLGTPFQRKVWHCLQQIPAGETISYLELAKCVGNAKAFRAVANANGANQLAIIIPCHRVINSNGKLGGYGGGVERKAWLIKHETYSCS